MALFHYTRTESAFKIIESGVLHATHWKYLNDGSEMEAVRPLLRERFAEEFAEEGDAMMAAGIIRRALVEDHGRRVFVDEADNMIDIAYRVTNEHIPVFIASLCRHPDGSKEAESGLLSQWRGYGADGGCALEFDEPKLRTMLAKEGKQFACTHVSLEPVEYHDHERILREMEVDGLARAMLRRLAGDQSKATEEAINKGMKGFQAAIGKIAPVLKNSAFSEENEVRIVIPCMSPDAAKEFPKMTLKPIQFRFRDGLPIPYVQIFTGKKPLPIKRIIVGPQRRQADVAHTIGLALRNRNMAVSVQCSSIPLVF